MQDEMQAIMDAYPEERRYVLAILQDMQNKFNYIPREGLERAAAHVGVKTAALYALATFYKALSLKPKGRHIIKVCDGTACHIRGASNLLMNITRELGVNPGETTEDGEFSLETVNCLGSCALAPVMVIDGVYYGKVTPDKLPQILREAAKEAGR